MAGIKDLRGRVVVITGAGSGIGRATAHAFAAEGARLVLADVVEARLDEVKAEVEARGAQAAVKRTDVSDRGQVEELAAFTLERFGQVDVLFNNAGVALGSRLEETRLEDIEWLFKIDVWGVLYGVHAFLPHMIARRQGHIINTASVTGICPTPGIGAYSMAKAAVVALSETLRAELKPHNIGVTALCPGIIDTRIVADGKMQLAENARANRTSVIDFYRARGWPPERVAKAALAAVRHDRLIVPVGPEAWAQWYAKRFSQRLYNFGVGLAVKYLM